MKRCLLVMAMMCVFFGVAGAMPVSAAYAFTTDTDGYIKIGSAADLTAFAAAINDGSLSVATNAKLTADIKLNEAINNDTTTDWTHWATPDSSWSLIQWTPIGVDSSHAYSGIFDGNGHTISGIYINSTLDYQGLFGYTTSGGTIKNLGVIKSYIHGGECTGGLAGYAIGIISNCFNTGKVIGTMIVGGVAGGGGGIITNSYNTGTVTGTNDVGGLAGNPGNISNCFNTGAVTGSIEIGGVAGGAVGSISNCYNTGSISGNVAGGIAGYSNSTISNCFNTGLVQGGGVAGRASGNNVTNCFYLAGTGLTGIGNPNSQNDSTLSKTDAEFASGEVAYALNTYSNFNSATWNKWTQDRGNDSPRFATNSNGVFANVVDKKITFTYADNSSSTYGYGYVGGNILALPAATGYIYTYAPAPSPVLNQSQMVSYLIPGDVTFTGYQLTQNNGVFEIATAAQLTDFARYVNDGNPTANAKLMADIELNAGCANWGNTQPPITTATWTPIGNTTNPYTGTFDGGDYIISGIYINNVSVDQGLFGRVAGTGTVKNLKVTNSFIQGGDNTGGIAGYLENSIPNAGVADCQVESANISGIQYVGGVVGRVFIGGHINNCTNAAAVTGFARVGGVTGAAEAGAMVENCQNSGSVVAVVNGTAVGGVAGEVAGSLVNCCNSGPVTGFGSQVGGITGTLSGPGTINNSYNTGAVTGPDAVGGVVGSVSSGLVSNCYNTGSIVASAGLHAGGIAGAQPSDGASHFNSCYYQENTVIVTNTTKSIGIGGTVLDSAGTAMKTSAEFASGAVAYALNHFNTPTAYPTGWLFWTQVPETALQPGFTSDITKAIDKKVTLAYDGASTIVKYGCNDSTIVNLPTEPTGCFYTYTSGSTILSHADMASKKFSDLDNLTFTVKRYQLTLNNGVFEIATADQLTDFARYVNDGNTTANAKLTADIVLNADCANWGNSLPNNATTWTPIGVDSSHQYAGTFDGNGHTISGIYINDTTKDNQGLFGVVAAGGIVKNLGVTHSHIEGRDNTGGLVGKSSGVISNCFNTSSVTGNTNVGGLAGNSARVDNCYNIGAVTGNSYVGGLAGLSSDRITNIYNMGSITSTDPSSGTIGSIIGGVNLVHSLRYGYFLNSIQGIGTQFDDGTTEAKSAADFASGQVAYLLQSSQSDPATPVWGQKLTGSADQYPLLKTADKVYQVTFGAGNGATTAYAYANAGGTVIPPAPPSGYAWKDSSQNAFTQSTPVNGDITLHTVLINTGGGGYSGPPAMPGITVTPGSITFNPTGSLAANLTGLPAGAVIFYSLDGVSYSSTPPAMLNAGTYPLYLQATCPGYQPYQTTTTITVAPAPAPILAPLYCPFSSAQLGQTLSFNLGSGLPPNPGTTSFAILSVADPGGILSGAPTISGNGVLGIALRSGQQTAADSDQVTAASLSEATVTVKVTMQNYEEAVETVKIQEQTGNLSVLYRTHVENLGWETDFVKDGKISGTTGQGLRLEALEVKLDSTYDLGVAYSTHIQNIGWETTDAKDGETSGTTGQGLRLEGLKLSLTGTDADKFDIYYQVHIQNQGWMDWAKNGEPAGSAGFGYRLEGLRIQILPKGSDAPGLTANHFLEK